MALRAYGTVPNGVELTIVKNMAQNLVIDSDTLYEQTLYRGQDVIIFPGMTLTLRKCVFLCHVLNFGNLSASDSYIEEFVDHPTEPDEDWKFSLTAKQISSLARDFPLPKSFFNRGFGFPEETCYSGDRFTAMSSPNALIVTGSKYLRNIFHLGDIVILPKGELRVKNCYLQGDVYKLFRGKDDYNDSKKPHSAPFSREKIVKSLSERQIEMLTDQYAGVPIQQITCSEEVKFVRDLSTLRHFKSGEIELDPESANDIYDLALTDIILDTEFGQKVYALAQRYKSEPKSIYLGYSSSDSDSE